MKMIRALMLLLTLSFLGCGEDQSGEIPVQEITYEVLYFEYIEDTGNDSSRLRYAITFTNSNDFEVKGFYNITTNADGVESTQFSSNTSPCYTIGKNSQCTYYFDEEDSHDLGRINAIELISVEYIIED